MCGNEWPSPMLAFRSCQTSNMNSLKRFDRILKIFFLLQSRSLVTNQELQQQFGIGRRTIYRDLQSLATAGIPVVNENGEGYSLMEGYRVQPPRFSQEEMLSLLVAEKIMQQHETSVLRRSFETAMIKIRASFLRHQKMELLLLEDKISFNLYARPGSYLSNIIDQLVNGILTMKAVIINYRKLNEQEADTRKVEPIGVYFHNHYWYVMAFCQLRQDYRVFRLDRIQSIRLTPEGFTGQHPSLDELRNSAFRNQATAVTIVVQQQYAHYLIPERELFGFTSEEEKKEEIVMHFNCRFHPQSFVRWLLKFADIARIAAPGALQQEMMQILKTGLQNNGIVDES